MENKRIPVEVEWLDAQTWSGASEEHEEIIKWKPVITHSCGYLIHEDKEKIIVSFMDFGDGYTKHFQAIPKGMIKEIKYLKIKRNKNPQKMKLCKGCYHKTNPNNISGYCYRCKRGKYNKETGKWEGGKK